MRMVLKEGIEGPVGVEGLGSRARRSRDSSESRCGSSRKSRSAHRGSGGRSPGRGGRGRTGAERGGRGRAGPGRGGRSRAGPESGWGRGGRGRGGPGRRGRGRGGRVAEIPWEWTDTKGPDNKPALFDFSGDLPGPKGEAIGVTDPLQCYHLFILKAFYSELLSQTNLYLQQVTSSRSSTHSVNPISMEELMGFIGLVFAMGITCLPSYRDYWCTDPIFFEYFLSFSYVQESFL